MNHEDHKTPDSQLSEDTISHLNSHLTKGGKTLLLTLYKYQPIQHKRLAEILDMKTNGLTNLMKRIDAIHKDFIEYKIEGRNKLYSLSQVAKNYTEMELLPEEAARKQAGASFLHTDPSIHDVLKFLGKFQESEGDDWDVVLDELLLAENRNESIDDPNANFREETYQNYTNFKNAMITLITHDQLAVQKVYDILEQKILTKRLDLLFSNLLENFNQMKPLFLLEDEKGLRDAQSLIDIIFSRRYPEIFGSYPRPLPDKYYGVGVAISGMIDEFKNNNRNKDVSIAQWEKKFYTRDRYNCLSYIAEKCSRL